MVKRFLKTVWTVTGLLGVFILVQLTLGCSDGATVAVIYDQNNKTYAFAASEMKMLIESAGYPVTLLRIEDLSKTKAENRIILTGRGTPEVDEYLEQPGISPLPVSSKEGYSIRKKENGRETDWYIIGFDKTGTIYGGLDLAESVQSSGFGVLGDTDKLPYLANRGIKFNIPLDARTPSYADNGDQAQKSIADMWDINFWHEFLDEMAKNRLNMLSLWSSAPFPSLVYVPEYPNASLNDIKKTTVPPSDFGVLEGRNMSNDNTLANLITLKTITIAEKVKFWQEVMQYAGDRGIDSYIFTWNTFVYGTENSGYGFTTSVTDSKTKDYFRKATRTLMETYPLLKGFGITAGENMSSDVLANENFLYQSYGQGINDALDADKDRTFRLIHRAHQSNIGTIKKVFSGLNSRCSFDFSYKYSKAHVYSSVAPSYIKEDDFIGAIGNSKFFMTIRDDDWYILRGGSDPEFTRAYLKNMPKTNLEGFYLGPDGYIWGREHTSNAPESSNQLILKKRWYSFRIWGKLAYDPEIPGSHFVKMLAVWFPEVNAQDLSDAWAKGSQVIPIVNRFHNSPNYQLDYQWYPEACYSCREGGETFGGFNNVISFINADPQNNGGLMSIRDYADAILSNTSMTGTTPPEVAQILLDISNQALSLTSGMTNYTDKELGQTINDIKAMAFLGQYYSKKILGATNKCLSDKSSDSVKKEDYKNAAIRNLQDASASWKAYADQVTSSYNPEFLTRMEKLIDVKAIQAEVDNDIVLVGGTKL
jgi:hypothetical protein